MRFKKIGIIGAGTMGIGSTVDLLFRDKRVVLVDVSTQALQKAETEIVRMLRFAPLINKDLSKKDPSIVKQQVQFTTSLEAVADCDYIVENVTEDWQVKEPIYRQLSEITKPDVCIAADTSCLSITKMAGVTTKPERIIGIHFMNPVYLKHTVEVIKGYHTSQACIDDTLQFLNECNKESVIVNDYPGFVSNRISHLFMNEAASVVQDGVATPAQVDKIFRECFGHTMGPLETADLIGLDTVMKSIDVLYNSYHDPKFRVCPLLRKMVDANLLGKKTGQGFYQY